MFKNALIYLFLVLFQLNFAQNQEYYFSHYKVENGLSHNSVLCSLQDEKGFLWFGTKDGLNRFDGHSFKKFRKEIGNSKSLGSNFIECMHEFNHTLWIGTESGLYQYNEVTEDFDLVKESQNNPILDIENDNEGNIWFIARSLLYKYNIKTKTVENYLKGFIKVEEITKTPNGQIWVAFQNILYQYVKETNSFKKCEIKFPEQPNLNIVISKIYSYNNGEIVIGTQKSGAFIYNIQNSALTQINLSSKRPLYVRDFIKKGNDLWMATESGLYIYNLQSKTHKNLSKSYNDPFTLSDNALYSLTLDNEEGIWIGSYFGGINYYPKPNTFFKKYFPKIGENSISGNAVREIKPDQQGNLWIGTEDAGVNKLNVKTGVFTNYLPTNNSNSISHYNIHGLLVNENKLWIGTFEHGLDVLDINTGFVTKHYGWKTKGNLSSNFVFDFYKTKKNEVYVITASSIELYNSVKDKFMVFKAFPEGYFYTSLVEDNNGALWAGTYWDGLFYYDPKTNTKRVFKHIKENNTSISSNAINGIFLDSKNNLWITTENGLNQYNFKTNKFKNYTVNNGLPSNVVYSILEDEKNNLWISTSKGLVEFNPVSRKIKVFTKANGLLSDQFNYHSSYKDNNGTMYFGSTEGMISFNPKKFIANKFKPPIYITSIKIDNKEIKSESKKERKSKHSLNQITLNPDKYTVNIEFATLSFNAPEMTEYWYKLEGLNEDWVYLGKNYKISFTGLSPNVYTFKVKSRNGNGQWSEESSELKIDVLPPFWKSNFAYALYSLLFISIGFLGLKQYHAKSKVKNLKFIKELNRKKEKELYKAKIEFFTNISHEIRTPLTLIKSPLEKILKKTDYDADLMQNLSIMDKNTSRLLDLVNQLLDFRKTEMGGTNLNFVRSNISEIIRNVHARFTPIINNKKINFSYDLGFEDVFASVDTEALNKIISNLFSNAIKYSNHIITLSLSQEGDVFIIAIKNDGKLISAHLKDKIFEPFFVISEKQDNSSTGIGLALAYSLVELHKGSLVLDHTVVDMNAFVLSLPIHQTLEFKLFDTKSIPEINNDIFEPSASSNTILTPKILVVEDNEDLLDFVAKELSVEYQVIKATNAQIALKILSTENVQLIVSDIMMPGMDGFNFCKEIKTNLETSHIPIILLTAKTTLNAKIKGLEFGADAYIEKPFSMEHLKVQISNLLSNRTTLIEYYSSSPLAHVKSIAHSTIDKIFIKKLDEFIYLNISDNKLSVDMLAENMNMSKSTLYRKIKNITDLSPNELINITRLKKAAELLTTGDYKIYEIAEIVGYSSQISLLRNFQKQFGMTPSEYLKPEHK